MIENISLPRSAKGATLPCNACASIPCGLAVRKQHKMLFAASKIESEKQEIATVRLTWICIMVSSCQFAVPLDQMFDHC